MDPKTLSNLDPKLKETYQRIMGTATNVNNEPTPTENQILTTPGIFNPDGLSSQIPTPQTPTPEQNNSQPTEALNTNIPPETSTYPTPANKPTSSTIKILYILAGIIFFLIYTFFWLKIFNFPLPF